MNHMFYLRGANSARKQNLMANGHWVAAAFRITF